MDKKQRILLENEILLDLWQQSKAGDSVAFCRLADKLYRTLFNYATSFTSDKEYIKDAIQELLIHIWEKRQTINIQFVTIYFLKSLRNQLLQEFRRNKHPFLGIDEIDEITDNQTIETEIEENETYSESQRRVRLAINELPKRQKEAIFLKFYEGLENEQIADLMQVNRQSVANLLFKAITTLKSQIPFLSHWILIIYTLIF
ncbi:RNA polymerase sigma-70 factor, ECF subfamily [Dyadobacter koreensis]|uniref:RNA polymerase sigma-70 factor, ECF subfamily n=1 Tax=Dyadobacter koreensis TaxID=408657 RepID=A0A1H6SC95_9BACT|nr:sigma-70 family RNA polymerase sigma factor [Dyadobacter koreensis]SEI61375.1 RNA polymerase sigma-70 factor, ECF subfamily [Dyadobacter koreensis]